MYGQKEVPTNFFLFRNIKLFCNCHNKVLLTPPPIPRNKKCQNNVKENGDKQQSQVRHQALKRYSFRYPCLTRRA